MKAEVAEFQTVKDLKPLLGAQGPCLTIYLPLSSASNQQGAKTNVLQWKELIREIQSRPAAANPQGREVIAGVQDFEALVGDAQLDGRSLVLFRSSEVFRLSQLDTQAAARAEIGPHFFIRPLLPELTRPKSFYILALSQKNVRLLHCTMRSSQEVELPSGVATSFEAYMNAAKPDHTTINRTSVGPSSGSSKGVGGTTSTEREAKDEYLNHFFKQIDHALNDVLRGVSEPVVLAGVDYEVALYRASTTLPNLAEESVSGAPNSLKSGEMHARAIDALNRCDENKIAKALAEYNHKVGGGASNRLNDVLKAANDGRILTLFVSDSIEKIGAFDENTYAIKGRETGDPAEEELVNNAAVQTILHAGQVFVVPSSKMPNGTPAAAIYRF